MEDAALILGGTVTGQAKGKSIRLPTVQAVFRRLCGEALRGDNRVLRRVIELMLTLEQAAREKAKEKEKETARSREGRRKYYRSMGLDLDDCERRRKERKPDPKAEEPKRRADAMVREERRRLMRESRRSQN